MADPTHSDILPTERDFRVLFGAASGLYLVLTPNLKITAVSDGYPLPPFDHSYGPDDLLAGLANQQGPDAARSVVPESLCETCAWMRKIKTPSNRIVTLG